VQVPDIGRLFDRPGRHRIRYADHLWRAQRPFILILLVGGPAMAVGFYFAGHGVFSQTVQTFLLYIPAGLLLVLAFYYYRIRSHVEVREDGLKVSNLLSSLVIPYEEIRNIRVQPLRLAFQDKRKRMVAPAMKSLLDQPALFVRLRSEEWAAHARRKLGGRLAYDDFVVVPVHDPDKVAWDLNGRLPERQGVNQGGGRRKKRRR
jgi:hypothetical protein